MVRLNFSAPINLAYNQRMSVVVDDMSGTKGSPAIANYGLILKNEGSVGGEINKQIASGEDKLTGRIHTFDLQMVSKELDDTRDYEVLKVEENVDAATELNVPCSSKSKDIIAFTVKTFPHYGAYGYINYRWGDSSSYNYGITLDSVRSGGDIF